MARLTFLFVQLVGLIILSAQSILASPTEYHNNLEDRFFVPLPSKDSFYDVPADIESYKPGAVLKRRRSPSPLGAYGETAWKFVKDAYQVLYRTTDGQGKATATVASILIPHKMQPKKLVSFSVASDSATMDCSPSFGFQLVSPLYPKINSATAKIHLIVVESALNRGWPVVVADHEGNKGAYPPNKLAAYATLDSIRAATSTGSFTGIDKKPVIALWGYSGGAGASLISVQLQESYAPELVIAGAAVGGLGGDTNNNTMDLIQAVNKGPIAGFIPVTALGVAAQLPGFEEELLKHLKPEYKDHFYEAGKQCLEANKKTFENENILAMFDDPTFFENITLPKIDIVPKVPLFWYQAQKDQLINVEGTTKIVADYCSQGASITYHIDNDPTVNHAAYGFTGTTAALKWLDGVLATGSAPQGCTTETVTSSGADPKLLNIYSWYYQYLIRQLLSAPPA